MGPHRDVVGELAAATRAQGLRFGVSSHTAEHWWWYGRGPHLRLRRTRHDACDRAALRAGRGDESAWPDGVDRRRKEPDPSHLGAVAAARPGAFSRTGSRARREIVDKYHPDFIYFDWWIGQPAFKPALQQFAAYYYDRSADEAEPVLTYKIEAMPANTATLDIERGKTGHAAPAALADRYLRLHPLLGIRGARRVPHRASR